MIADNLVDLDRDYEKYLHILSKNKIIDQKINQKHK